MARIYLNLPNSWQSWSAKSSVRCLALITVAALFVIIITMAMFKTTSSWQKNDLTNWNPKYRRKPMTSIHEQTDTSDATLHYGIVIDCGSTGSRVYIYFWPTHSGDPKDLLDIQPMRDKNANLVNKKIEPGLSSIEDRPAEASIYMKPLLDYASQHVPESKHKETPLYILATAGMRLLPVKNQEALLEDLRQDIPKEYQFLVAENHFEVITGKQEGVYSWVAINFVLGKFVHGEEDHPLVAVNVPGVNTETKLSPHIRRRTVGMIDMGGASVQIAYEVPQTVRYESVKEKEIAKSLLADFNLGCKHSDLDHTYRVYVTTFLGYGANEARERYESLLIIPHISGAKNVTSLGLTSSRPIPDPCLPVNMPLETTGVVDETTVYYLKGTGDFSACQKSMTYLLNLTVPCQKPVCSMNGVYQPDIKFYNSEFYGFSEFWYTTEDVFRSGGLYDNKKFEAVAKDYCHTEWSTLMDWYDRKLYPKANKSRFMFQCFKAAWMYTILHEGFKFPKEYEYFRTTQLVNGKDVQWTLGALIHRTRFIPLREIEKLESEKPENPPWIRHNWFYTQYTIVFCFFVVLMAIILYIRRLRLCQTAAIRSGMSRVPSMSYFMMEGGEVEPGLQFVSGYGYTE